MAMLSMLAHAADVTMQHLPTLKQIALENLKDRKSTRLNSSHRH